MNPYETNFERQRKILVDRYMSMKPTYALHNSNERYQWAESCLKNQYHPDVKVNNWSEERRDLDYIKHRKPLLNDYKYAYETEYCSRFGDWKGGELLPHRREAKGFPGHQPELDLPQLKKVYQSYETTSRVAYQDPSVVTTRKPETKCAYCRLNMGQLH